MKKILIILFILTTLLFSKNVCADFYSEEINKKYSITILEKKDIIKQLNFYKNEISIDAKFDKIIIKVDFFVNKIKKNEKKLIGIYKKISKIKYKIKNKKRLLNILNYIEAKILVEIYNLNSPQLKDNSFLNTKLFFSYLNVGNYEEAYKYNEKLISSLNKDTNLNTYNFYISYYNNIDKEKVEFYLEYLEKNKIINNIIYGDILFLSKMNKNDNAEKYYNLALLENINKEYIYNQLGLIQDYKYNYKKSLELYKKSYKIDKNNILTLKNLCISRYLNYKYLVLNIEKTEEEKNIIKKGSNEALFYCNAYLKKEKKDKYIILDAETYKYIGHIYKLGLGNKEKAEYFYLKAIKINPYDYKSYNNLSAIYREIFEKYNTEEILLKEIKYSKKAFELSNNDFFRKNLIISYNLAINYYSEKNNYNEFKNYSDKALKLDTINFGIKYIIGSKFLNFYTKTQKNEYYILAEKYLKEELIQEEISSQLKEFDGTKRWVYYKLSLLYFRYSKINNSKTKINDSIKIMKKGLDINKSHKNDELKFKINGLSLIQSNYHLLYIITKDKKYLKNVMEYGNLILENLSENNKIEWQKQYLFLKEIEKLIKSNN